MAKVLKRIGIGLGIALIIALVYYWPLIDQLVRFSPRVAEASFDSPANELEAQQQDFAYLAEILEYDRSFSPAARQEFSDRVALLASSNSLLDDAAFFMETHALMALADNAHTSADHVAAFRRFNRLGVDFYIFEDGLYVVRTHNSLEHMLGQKLVSIDSRGVDELLTSLTKYSGGPKARRDLISLYFMRSPELLHAAGLGTSSDAATIVLEDLSGEQQEHALRALEPAAETEFAYRHPYHTLLAQDLPEEQEEWVSVLGSAQVVAPLTFQDDADLVLSREIQNGLYVRSNYLWEYPNHPVEAELTGALEDAPENGFPFVFVDLRWNPGGRFSHAIPFAEKVGSAVKSDGKIYVAVGPQTFSAAIVMAALIKQHAPNRTVIIGEPMGDRPQFWAERGQQFVLPNSGYHIGYATGFHDWERRCADEVQYCFPPNRRNAADIGHLKVDVPIQPTFAQYAAGLDPVLTWALGQH